MLRLANVSLSFLFACFVLVSCSSIPSRGSLAGATVVGEASDVFVFVPVKHNRTLLSRILPQNNYVEKALDRTEYIYLSLKVKNKESSGYSFDDSSNDDSEEDIFNSLSYDVCAIGRYPKSIAGLVFNKNNGWQRQKTSSGYKYYKKLNHLNAKGLPSFSFFSIPSSNLALLSYNEHNEYKMENLIDRVDSPYPVRFGEEFEIAIQQGGAAQDVCIYVANPHFFLSNLLALEIDLPIDNLKVYLKRNTEKTKEFYHYKIVLQMRNITASFATRLLLSKILKTQVRVEDNNIIVEKARVSLDKLVQIINKVLNREL